MVLYNFQGMSNAQEHPTTASMNFQSPDADVIARSADNIIYRLHRANLELIAGAFPLNEICTSEYDSDGVKLLSESSKTLDILFLFLYPLRYVTLEDMEFEHLILLAEAAEKYRIPAAMYGCQVQLRKFMNSNPQELMDFGTRHDYPMLALQLAPTMIDTPIAQLTQRLNPQVYMAWSIYRERWLGACHQASLVCPKHKCPWWGQFALHVIHKLEKPSSFRNVLECDMINPKAHFSCIYSADNCCLTCVNQWREAINRLIAAIPAAASLLSTTPETTTLFQASDGDVVVRSSDGQDFSLHKKNLGLLTEGFPSAETPTDGEVVPLSESSTTLRLLFQFVYSQRYPSLEKLDFETTLELAEAAEKYIVHPAIYACKFRLSEFVDIRPRELLQFAARHNYSSIIVQLAPLLIDMPLSGLVGILPLQIYAPWSIHREHWLITLHSAVTELTKQTTTCTCWRKFAASVSEKLDKPSRLQSEVVKYAAQYSGMCTTCSSYRDAWMQTVTQWVNSIPKLSIY